MALVVAPCTYARTRMPVCSRTFSIRRRTRIAPPLNTSVVCCQHGAEHTGAVVAGGPKGRCVVGTGVVGTGFSE